MPASPVPASPVPAGPVPPGPVPPGPDSSPAARRTAAGRIARLAAAARGPLGRHRVFVIALAAGAALRIATELGYRWAIWFNDSFDYVAIALRLRPDPMRPIGYPVLLWLVRPLHSLTVVTSLQHLLGLGTAVAGYLLLRGKFGLPGWGATLAMAPVLFDAFQIQLEQLLLSDTLFTFLAVGAVTVLCWLPASRGERMSAWQGALAGGLLALAALTRPVGIPLIVIAVGYLVICRVGWRAVTAAGAAAVAPLAGYALWFHAIYGQFALDSTNGIYLWGRTAAFAECDVIRPPPSEAWLCPRLPPAQRAASSAQVWQPNSPLHWQHGQVFSARENDLAMRFALRAIAAQPGGYAQTVLASLGRAFAWDRTPYPTGTPPAFIRSPEPRPGCRPGRSLTGAPRLRSRAHTQAAGAATDRGGAVRELHALVPALRVPARHHGGTHPVITPAACSPGGCRVRVPPAAQPQPPVPPASRPGQPAGTRAGAVPGWARRLGDPAAWLCWSAAVALLVFPPLTVDFDYRYMLPVVPFGCLAAALAARRFLVTAGHFHGRPDAGGAAETLRRLAFVLIAS